MDEVKKTSLAHINEKQMTCKEHCHVMITVYQRTDYRGSGRSKCKRRNSDDALDFTVTVTG